VCGGPWSSSVASAIRVAHLQRSVPAFAEAYVGGSAATATDVGRYVPFAPNSGPYRRHELLAGAVLGDIAEGAGRVAALCQLGVVVNGDEDDSRVRAHREKRRRGCDAVETRHHDVSDDHVWSGSLRCPDKCVPVSNRGDDVEFGGEQIPQLFGHPRVILGQHHPRSVHAPTVGAVAHLLQFGESRRRSGELRRRAPGALRRRTALATLGGAARSAEGS
jgi:hypothetical protein